MSVLNWLWNGAKGVTNAFGVSTSAYENDEAQSFQAQQAQMNRDWQEQMLQKQFDYQTEMWNKSNEYNSAKSQAQRYREAGLNPYIMMTGGASAGVATSSGTPSGSSAPSVSGGFANSSPPTSFSSLMDSFTKKENAKADIRLKNADATIKEVEAEYTRQLMNERLLSAQRDNNLKGIDIEWNPKLYDASVRTSQSQINSLEARAKLDIMETAYREIEKEKLPDLLKGQIAVAASQVDLNKANAKSALADDILKRANAAKVDVDKKTAERMADSIVEKAQRDVHSVNGLPDAISRGIFGSINVIKHKLSNK